MSADGAGSIVRAAFDRFDLNGDGALDAHEFKTMMAKIGTPITDLEVAEMVAKADISGDGRIQSQEFLTFAARILSRAN